MSRRPGIYTLLVAVGKYDSSIMVNDLKCSQNDLTLMARALEQGLKIDSDNMRKLGGDDPVKAMSFARSIAEFDSLLQEEDTFLFYFSGHGRNCELMFTDGGITIESIVDHIEKLPAKRKIVILDCCYSGQAKAGQIPTISFEDSITAFAGKGIAVFASCAADEESRLADGGRYSLYTQILYYALTSRRNIRKGEISLTDISEEVRYLMEQWNRTHPGKEQRPIFRESMIGTIFFKVQEYHPYMPQRIFLEVEDYVVHHVKPMSTGALKRLAAFVILKNDDDSIIPKVTMQIVPQILYSDVYSSKQSEMRFRGRPADVIWCYFGHDEEDLVRGNHFAYTIWSGDERLRETYYRENRNAEIVNNVYVFWNSSYQIVKDLQKSEQSEDEIEAEYRKLSNMLIAHAEPFIKDLEEVENGTLSFQTVKIANQKWIHEVRGLYFKLSEAEVPPIGIHDWAEAVLNLAGWIVDMAVLFENTCGNDRRGEWLLQQAKGRYHRSLDELYNFEKRE